MHLCTKYTPPFSTPQLPQLHWKYLSKGCNFSLSRSCAINLSSILGILPTPAPRLDLIFQSQFCACLIHGSAYNCHTVHYILHPQPLKFPRPCIPHPQNQGRPNSVGLAWEVWQAESQIPPRTRETDAGKGPPGDF